MRYFALKVEFVSNISCMIVDLPQNLIYLNVLKNILKPLHDFFSNSSSKVRRI